MDPQTEFVLSVREKLWLLYRVMASDDDESKARSYWKSGTTDANQVAYLIARTHE